MNSEDRWVDGQLKKEGTDQSSDHWCGDSLHHVGARTQAPHHGEKTYHRGENGHQLCPKMDTAIPGLEPVDHLTEQETEFHGSSRAVTATVRSPTLCFWPRRR